MQASKLIRLLIVLNIILICPDAMYSQKALVDNSVREVLRRNSQTMVLVKLKEQPPWPSKQDQQTRRIQQLQISVLSVLTEEDFQC